jgi:glycosyltransferase involved in cell wall biosynthesis
MQNKLISVCIPTYNQTIYLMKTISSVFSQKGVTYEVIVSDDSTNNEVFYLVESLIKSGKEIRYYRNNPNLGSPENWNFALDKAKGEFIKIMHHDEWFITENALSKMLEKCITNPDLLVVSSSLLIDRGVDRIFKATNHQLRKIHQEPERLILGNVFGSPSAVMFSKNKMQLFNRDYIWLVDIEFYVRMLNNNMKFHYIEEPLYCSVMDEHNITNSVLYDVELQLKEYSNLFKKYIRKFHLIKQFIYFLEIYKIISIRLYRNKHILFLRLFKRSFFDK